MKTLNKVAIALGSGGPRGLAHIGVIKALEKNHIPIDIVVGTSVGSLMGGLYLSLGSISEVEKIFVDLKISELAGMFSDLGLGSGLIKGGKLEDYLNTFVKGVKIEDLPKLYAAVSTDLKNGEYIEIMKGSLTKAIRASSSLPGFIDIISMNGNYMIDGGVTQPVPIKTARNLGATHVIAVNLDQYDFVADDLEVKKPNAAKMGLIALKLLRYSLAHEQCKQADIVINPQVADIAWMNLTSKNDRIEIIRQGYEATIKSMKSIKQIVGI